MMKSQDERLLFLKKNVKRINLKMYSRGHIINEKVEITKGSAKFKFGLMV